MATQNIATLLRAAEFIERRDREIEHGYATTLPAAYQRQRQQRVKSGKSHGSLHRYTHNELEKTRRANQRRSLERLKEIVPLGPQDSRHTTLSLLEKARTLIRVLDETHRRLLNEKQDLIQNQQMWRRKLVDVLSVTGTGGYRDRRRDESSPVSSITDSTSSEQDMVDVIGSQSSEGDDVSSDGEYWAQTSELNLGL